MARLVKSDVETVLNFLQDRIDADDLPQVEEILTRNLGAGAAEDEPEPRPGGEMDHPVERAGVGMDSRRRDFEKRNGIAPRRIRVLGC